MIRIGLIRERKKLPDERVAFTPKQCAYLMANYEGLQIVVEPSPTPVERSLQLRLLGSQSLIGD